MIYANPKITSLYLFADNIQQIGIIRRYEPTHKRIILASTIHIKYLRARRTSIR